MSNTALSSSALGLSLTKATLGSCELDQLISELVSRLTGLEKLGLLSDTGKSLMLLLQRMATPSTDGSAESLVNSGTFTYLPRSEWLDAERDWWGATQVPTTQSASHGHTSLPGTRVGTTRG